MNPIYLVAAGGVFLFLLLVFQVLLGLRKIKFKGALHMKVHKWTAYSMLALAAFHGLFALGTLVFRWF
ncbi:MAG TPA: hypothetical protein VF902_07415 [Coriobacteriia bacterium]